MLGFFSFSPPFKQTISCCEEKIFGDTEGDGRPILVPEPLLPDLFQEPPQGRVSRVCFWRRRKKITFFFFSVEEIHRRRGSATGAGQAVPAEISPRYPLESVGYLFSLYASFC